MSVITRETVEAEAVREILNHLQEGQRSAVVIIAAPTREAASNALLALVREGGSKFVDFNQEKLTLRHVKGGQIQGGVTSNSFKWMGPQSSLAWVILSKEQKELLRSLQNITFGNRLRPGQLLETILGGE